MEKSKRKNKNEDEQELKEVHRVWGPAEAEVVKTFLESNGISCIFRGQVVQSVSPFSADGLGEIKILVTKKAFKIAKKLIESQKT